MVPDTAALPSTVIFTFLTTMMRDDASRVKSCAALTTLSVRVQVLLPVSTREPSDRVLVPVHVRLDDDSVTAAANIVVPIPSVKAEVEESKKVDPTLIVIAGAVTVVQDTVAKSVRETVPAE